MNRDSGSHRRSIAAQGPLPSTAPHFLQMLAENEIEIVVILTKVQEENAEGGNSIMLFLDYLLLSATLAMSYKSILKKECHEICKEMEMMN